MFDPRTFLLLAERSIAVNADDSEAMFRTAVGRAYYAAFLVAREYVRRHGLMVNPPSGKRWGSHERVIFSVGMLREPSVRPIRKALFRLKKQRTNADYELGYELGRTHVLKAIQDAQMIIAWIDGLPSP